MLNSFKALLHPSVTVSLCVCVVCVTSIARMVLYHEKEGRNREKRISRIQWLNITFRHNSLHFILCSIECRESACERMSVCVCVCMLCGLSYIWGLYHIVPFIKRASNWSACNETCESIPIDMNDVCKCWNQARDKKEELGR